MSVHYKFKSACEFSTLPVDGVNISVEDLKEAIIEQKRLSRSQPFDLIITNAETNKVYTDEKTLIPKNSSLLVARVPIDASQMKRPWNNHLKESTEVLLSNPANLMNTEESSAEAIRLSRLAMQVTDLTKMAGSEQDRINAMMAQSTLDYHPSRYVKLRNSRMSGKVPVGYTCFKCSKGGHWVANCPLSNQDLRKSYGIPSDQLIRVTDPNTPGVMVTARGNLVIYKKNPEAIVPSEPSEEPERLPLPAELQCGLCNELLRDPVLIPCCAQKFCDDCIREHLIESNDGQCPKCLENDVSVGKLIPNRYLRKKVADFDKLTNGNHIKNYEKQYLSPPASVAPLPPHLRSSKQNTPRSSPPAEASKAPQETCVSSDQTKKVEPVLSPKTHNGSDAQIEESPKPRTDSPGIPLVSSLPSSPSNLLNVAVNATPLPPEASPPVELYRGLLKDVEENERALASKKNSPIASQSDVESEKGKKSKKKKEKKKKNGKDKEKKKEKHKRSNKSHKNRRDESMQPSENAMGALTEVNRDISSPGRGRKRSRSSESASSTSPRPDKKLNDSTTELFNVALNIPYGQNAGAPYPYTGSDAMYPPGLPNFSVPPPGYIVPPQHPSQSWLPIGPDTIIDDPLAAFNRHLQEKDERKRREQMRRQRSPSYGRPYPSRNWSRSRSRSPSDRPPRSISRSPRLRRHRWSRSRSPYSPRRYHSPPSHRRMANSPPSMHRRYSPVDRRQSPPSSHPKFINTPEQRHRGDRLRTSSRSRSPSVRAKHGGFSPARPHLVPPHQRALQQPGRGSPSHGSASPANRAFMDEGATETYLRRGGRERPELHPERREARPSVKDRLAFEADDPRRTERLGEMVRGPPMAEEYHGRPDHEHPPFGDTLFRTTHLSPCASSPGKKMPRSRSPNDRSVPRHYDSKSRRLGMSPSPPTNKSPYDRNYRETSRSRSRGRNHRGRYRDDSSNRNRRYSPNREESRAFLERVDGSPKDASSLSSRSKNISPTELREAQRHSSNARRRGFSSERSRSRSRDRRVRDSRRSNSRSRRRDARDDSNRRQEYKSKNSSVTGKEEVERSVTREGQRTPENTLGDRHAASEKDGLSKGHERNKLDETQRHDKKKIEHGKSGDRHRSDKYKQDDRVKSDDRNRSDDRVKSDDRNRSDDHVKLDDRCKDQERNNAIDEKEKSEETHKTDVKEDCDISKDEEKHKLDKDKKKREKKKKKKEKKERRLSQQSECSQNETTDDEPKKKKKKQDKKEKDANSNPLTSEMKEVQITSGTVSISSSTPELNRDSLDLASSVPAPSFSPSLLPELSKWERDDETSDANQSSESLKEEKHRSEPVVTSDVLRKAESALLHGRGVLGRVLLPRKGFAESERAKQLEEHRAKSEMSEFPFELIDREAKTKGPSIQITISSKSETDIWMKKPSSFPVVAPEPGVTEPQPANETRFASKNRAEEKTEIVGSEESSSATNVQPSSEKEVSPNNTLPEIKSMISSEFTLKTEESLPTTDEKTLNVGEQPKSELLESAIPKLVDDDGTTSSVQKSEECLLSESKDISLQQKSAELLQSSEHLLQLGDSVLKKLPPLEKNASLCREAPLVKVVMEGARDGAAGSASKADSSFLSTDIPRLCSIESISVTNKESLERNVSIEGGEPRKDGERSGHTSDLAHSFHSLPNFLQDRSCRESTASTEATTEEEIDKKKKRKKRKRSVSSSSSSDSDSSSDSNSDSEAESQRKKRKKNKKKKKNEGRNGEDGEGRSKKKKKKDKKRKKSKKEKKLKKLKS